jgi:hypothetical protein
MPLSALTCLMLLASCSQPTAQVFLHPDVPPALLRGCAGWSGPTPTTEAQLASALLAEKRGRQCEAIRASALIDVIQAP